jgi:hypothetical protein
MSIAGKAASFPSVEKAAVPIAAAHPSSWAKNDFPASRSIRNKKKMKLEMNVAQIVLNQFAAAMFGIKFFKRYGKKWILRNNNVIPGGT